MVESRVVSGRGEISRDRITFVDKDLRHNTGADRAAAFANGLLSGLDAVAAFERVQETLVDPSGGSRNESQDSKVRRLIG